MRTLKLRLDALRVESFAVTEAGPVDNPWRSFKPLSCLPMCTDVSCTAGFPECDFSIEPTTCPVVETGAVGEPL